MIYDQHYNLQTDPDEIVIAQLFGPHDITTAYLGPTLIANATIRDMKELRERLNDPRIHDPSQPQIGGWGNGYVTINKLHPWYNEDLQDKLTAPGGITYNIRNSDLYTEVESYTAGFDSFHYLDTLDNCSKEYVIEQTLNMFYTLLKAYIESDFFVDYNIVYF